MNKVDELKDKELIELVEMEVRDLLTQYKFDGKNAMIVAGSALCALVPHHTHLPMIVIA